VVFLLVCRFSETVASSLFECICRLVNELNVLKNLAEQLYLDTGSSKLSSHLVGEDDLLVGRPEH